MIPISLLVAILQYVGFVDYLSIYTKPLFAIIGLPGEAAIVFITSIFVPLYIPIAIIATLPLSMRDITLLAVMCLIAHNLFVETAVQSKTGSKFAIIFFLRIIMAFVAAYLLNFFLPAADKVINIKTEAAQTQSFKEMILAWLVSSLWLIFKITLIIYSLMALQSIMKAYRWLDWLSNLFAPLMKVMGLPKNTSFLWIVAHTLGLAYGSAVMIEESETGRITRYEANLLNYHIAINHSTLEDTMLFVAIGVPFLWMAIPRFILSIILVWSIRLVYLLK